MDPIGGDGNRNTLHALPASPLHPFPSSRGNCDLDEGGDGSLNIQPICLSRFVGREEWGEGGCFKIRGNFFTEFAPVLIPIIGIRCTAEVVSRIGWKIGWNRLLSAPSSPPFILSSRAGCNPKDDHFQTRWRENWTSLGHVALQKGIIEEAAG